MSSRYRSYAISYGTEHQAKASTIAATRAVGETELSERLSVVSVLMFWGRYPNIDRWAMTAGRYEGAKAE